MRESSRLAILLLVLAGVACAPPVAQRSTEIEELSRQWVEALNAGDVDALAAMYAEDCHVLPPNAEGQKGRGAARAAFGEMIDAGLSGGLKTIEAIAAGDLGHHVGTYTLQAGGVEVDRGKFTELWRKVDGRWMIVSDMWSSDLPEGSGKTFVTITHDVRDGKNWLAAWQGPKSRRGLFGKHGAPSVRVFQDPDDPKHTALVVEVEDMDALTAFLTSPEADAAKAEDGVVAASVRMLREVK